MGTEMTSVKLRHADHQVSVGLVKVYFMVLSYLICEKGSYDSKYWLAFRPNLLCWVFMTFWCLWVWNWFCVKIKLMRYWFWAILNFKLEPPLACFSFLFNSFDWPVWSSFLKQKNYFIGPKGQSHAWKVSSLTFTLTFLGFLGGTFSGFKLLGWL